MELKIKETARIPEPIHNKQNSKDTVQQDPHHQICACSLFDLCYK